MSEDLEKALGDAKVLFWTCHCVERTTIRWIGDTAVCETCGDTNKAKYLRYKNSQLLGHIRQLNEAMRVLIAKGEKLNDTAGDTKQAGRDQSAATDSQSGSNCDVG